MIMNSINITLTSLYSAYSEIMKLFYSFSKNNKIFTKYDGKEIFEFTDYNRYKNFLFLIADEIYEIALTKRIFIEYDVITDIFFIDKEKVKIPIGFDMCKVCPCYQCFPDIELFEKYSKNKYFPFENYCKKHFVEKNASVYLYNKLKELSSLENCFEPNNIGYIDFIQSFKIKGEQIEKI